MEETHYAAVSSQRSHRWDNGHRVHTAGRSPRGVCSRTIAAGQWLRGVRSKTIASSSDMAHFTTADASTKDTITRRPAPLLTQAGVAITATATTVTDRCTNQTRLWLAARSPSHATMDGGSGKVSMSSSIDFSLLQALPLPTHQVPLRATQVGIAQTH